MASMGLPEVLVILLLAALVAAPFLLKRKLPRKEWLGVLLAFVLGPWGHWYIAGGVAYVIGLWALAALLGLALQSTLLSWAIVGVVSALFMFYRFSGAVRSEPIDERRV